MFVILWWKRQTYDYCCNQINLRCTACIKHVSNAVWTHLYWLLCVEQYKTAQFSKCYFCQLLVQWQGPLCDSDMILSTIKNRRQKPTSQYSADREALIWKTYFNNIANPTNELRGRTVQNANLRKSRYQQFVDNG